MSKLSKREKQERNRRIFKDVINHYIDTKYNSKIMAVDLSRPERGTPNPARPTPVDFMCDVEMLIERIVPKTLLKNFFNEYIMENNSLDQSEKDSFEQQLGSTFAKCQMWPIRKYFLTIRKKVNESNKR